MPKFRNEIIFKMGSKNKKNMEEQHNSEVKIDQGGATKGRVKRFFLILATSLGALILVALILGGITLAIYWGPTQTVKIELQTAKQKILSAKDNFAKNDFNAAKVDLQASEDSFVKADEAITKINTNPISSLPIVNEQVTHLNDLLLIGRSTNDILLDGAEFGSQVMKILNRQDLSLKDLNQAERSALLGELKTLGDRLEQANFQVAGSQGAWQRLQTAKNSFIWGPIVNDLSQVLPTLYDSFDSIKLAAEIAPEMLGYQKEKVYLFLMQNNDELRPTGGFIGTYGVVRIKDGSITSFFTDNIYNLDFPSEKYMSAIPPDPIIKYLGIGKWFVRDANWSPDFPTSVQKIKELYKLEGGKEKFDGVIAVNPNVFEDLLGLVGEIQVDGLTFNKDNFTDELQYQVESGFYRRGIEPSARKELIGDLAKELETRLYALPSNQWKDVTWTIKKNLDEKYLLTNFNNQQVQSVVEGRQWAGNVIGTENDYLMIIDANLAALKTDRVMEKSYTYQLNESKDSLNAVLTLNYHHTAGFDWKTTRYQTYTRVYVPEDSQLKSFVVNGKVVDIKLVDYVNELGKQSFGYYFEVEPGKTTTLTYQYTLPATLKDKLEKQSYQLNLQKQPGVQALNINFDLNFLRPIKLFAQGDKVLNKIQSQQSVVKDELFTVEFK